MNNYFLLTHNIKIYCTDTEKNFLTELFPTYFPIRNRTQPTVLNN